MTRQHVLRAVAFAIAIAAFVDPAITRRVTVRQPLTIVTVDAADLSHAERLQRQLAGDVDAAIHAADPTSLAAACPSTGGCVVVSRGDVPRRLSAGATVLGALRVDTEDTRRTIRRVVAPDTVHRDAASTLQVSLTRPVTRVDVLDGDVLVGSVRAGDSLDVEVTWVPLATGARALRVVAGDDAADVGVVVDASAMAVFVYEPEPTWIGTFVRRALDDDPRFAVVGRTRVAPPVSVTRGGVSALSTATIGDAGVIVVTAPHTLGASDVELLHRFVTVRGGSLMVIPDQRPSGPVLRLLPRVIEQLRDPQPRDVGVLRVREWLTFDAAAGTTTLAALAGEPIVIARAVGRGRVIVSGALDAWRFRDPASNFNTFWTGLAWQSARAAGTSLDVSAEYVLARPGEPIRLAAQWQSLDRTPEQLTAAGSMSCAGQRDAVRWWPGGRPGTFEGVVRLRGRDVCELAVTVNGVTTTRPFVVRDDVRRREVGDDALEAAIEAHGGIVAVSAADETDLVTHVRTQLPAVETSAATRPMRSPYWLIILAVCLSSEWWLRRQAGLS